MRERVRACVRAASLTSNVSQLAPVGRESEGERAKKQAPVGRESEEGRAQMMAKSMSACVRERLNACVRAASLTKCAPPRRMPPSVGRSR